MKKLGMCAVLSLMCATAVSAQVVDTIDFESVAPGCVVSEIYGAGGQGPIGVNGLNPAIAGQNLAVIFDSSNPTGGDLDLGTPNQTFCPTIPDPACPGVGTAGEMGMPFENGVPQGNLLIVDEEGGAVADAACAPEGRIADPDDADVVGASLDFDFSMIGPVVIDSITILDTEPDEEAPAVVTLFDGAMMMITQVELPTPGDNGVDKVSLGDVPGVVFMDVTLNGSGAIDDIVFCLCDDDNACTTDTCVDGQCVNTPIVCEDGDACTTDSCDPAIGCVFTEIDCDDGDLCTEDRCDPQTGACVYEDVICEDSDECTDDFCDPALGCVYTEIDCDDGDLCTEDSCDPATGCVNEDVECDDNDPCTDDFCDPAVGCVYEDNGECGGGEGCTPGFWKGPGFDCHWVNYQGQDDYETVFGVDASFTKTLLGTLQQGGGGEKALGRHAVAALLNAANGGVDYAYTGAGVIALVQAAYADCSLGDNSCFNSYKAQLEAENDPTPCPIDACNSRGNRGRR